MAAPLEADVALIHVAGGDARVSPPPGTMAQTPPRRAARGRGEDMLFLTLATTSGQPGGSGPLDTLARQAAQTFYGTPGTITAALREAAADVNQRLLSANQRTDGSTHIEGRLMAAILRGNDLYLAQSGSGQAVIIRPGQISRFTSDEAAARPLGVAVAPNVRFHHAQVGPGDILVLTASPSPPWSDPVLSGLAGLEPAQAVERLVAASGQDLTGLLIRLASPGGSPVRASVSPPALVGPARPAGRAPTRDLRPGGLRRQPTPTSRALQRAMRALALPFQAIGRSLTGAFPSLAPSGAGMSQGLLAATAVAVPLVVVAIVTVVYLRRGRAEQYQQFLSQAQTAVVAAQLKLSLEEARPEWEAAAQWLDQARDYGNGSEAESLRQQVQLALDRLNNIARLEFAPAVGGGFGPRARLRAVAATANDLYVYDESRPEIYHAWFTGRGYEIDREFQCLEALQPGFVSGRIIDVLIQPEPGALGTQGIVAIDAAGNLIYCAPGAAPATGLLTPPDTGWGKIQAVDLSGDRLYVLDPKANQVWIYTTADGLFVGTPSLYFTEIVQNLSHAVDLAASQDELVVLHDDGLVDLCRRPQENAPDGSLRIRIECNKDLDLAPGEATLTSVIYSPPPEPSLYFLDPQEGTVVQYSMRLVYQARFIPTPGLRETPVDLAVGPPHDLFLVAGDQVYFAQPTP